MRLLVASHSNASLSLSDDDPPTTPPGIKDFEKTWSVQDSFAMQRTRPWTDACITSNAFILGVSIFLVYCKNIELAILAFLLFLASMGYHRSNETNMMYMQVDIMLGRFCCLYYVISTSMHASWENTDLLLKLAGYAAFAVIAFLTNGPQALVSHTPRYNQLHPLVHILGIIPPTVGGLICKPFIV